MFIRTKPIANSSRKRVQICECFREGYKVKQKVIRHVGIATNDSHLEELRKLAEFLKQKIKDEREGPFLFENASTTARHISTSFDQEPQIPNLPTKTAVFIEDLKEEMRVVDGFHDIFGTLFNQIGFHRILNGKQNEVLRDIILARIAHPSSKLESQQVLADDFGREIDLDRIYRMMDALVDRKEEVQKTVFLATEQLCFGRVDIALFDVTTLYFESTEEDELRAFGYSKDQKFHSTQVVLALATASNGLPIGYSLFPGNTAEVSTLIASLESWKKIMPIGKVRFVADRAMMAEKNLQMLEEAGHEYIIAAKLKKLPKPIQEEILRSPRDESKIVLDRILDGGRRMVVSFCPLRKRKDEFDRKKMLDKVHKKIGKGKNAKKLVSNTGYRKYLSLEGESNLFLDEKKIAQDAAWDGFHGVITSCQNEKAEELLSNYRRLWVIEASFRLHKHNLSIRPIYHFKPERIEAHILICYMAFTLMRHLEFRIGLQKEKVTMEEMRKALWRVQSSYLNNAETGKKYRLPSHFGIVAKKIYQVMGIKRFQMIAEM